MARDGARRSALPGLAALTTLAFQVWDGVGWLGQAVFTVRVLQQWWLSEKAGKSVLPASFWTWSLLGTLALLVYCLHRRDPVFLAGALVNGCLYARNLLLVRREEAPRARPRSPLLPVLLGLGIFGGFAVAAAVVEKEVLHLDQPWPWLVVGGIGQGLWSSRFVVQWYASERAAKSVLPASFFRMSVVGALFLFAYAVHRVDWVQMFAFGLNPIPYARNLVLLRRARRAEEAAPPSAT